MGNDEIFQTIKEFMLSCDSWNYIGTDVTRDTNLDDSEYGDEVVEWAFDKYDVGIAVDEPDPDTTNVHTLGELVDLIGIYLADKPFKL